MTAAAACLLAGSALSAPASDSARNSAPSAHDAPVLIFFENGSAEIAPSARPLANRALAEAVGEGEASVRVEGYAGANEDSTDTAEALARERVKSVEAFLAANGIPRWRIDTRHAATSEVLDPTFAIADSRVEVRVRPGNRPVVAGMR